LRQPVAPAQAGATVHAPAITAYAFAFLAK
jgi:hypothetical protein